MTMAVEATLAPPTQPKERAATFRAALARPDLRWLLAHHTVGGVAQSFSTVAVAVHLFDLTGSHGWVAAAGVARLGPYLVISGVAGLLADRVDRRRLLIGSSLIRGGLLVALLMAVAADVPPGIVVGLVALATAVGTPCYPAVAAVVPRLVPQRDLPAATGLLNLIETSVWLVGPALGGMLLLGGEPATALAVNAGLLVGAALLAVMVPADGAGTPPRGSNGGGVGFTTDLREGVRALGTPTIAGPLVCVVAVNVLLGTSSILLLSTATEVFDRPSGGYALLTAALGSGGFLGILVTNRLAVSTRPTRCIAGATLVAGVPFALTASGGPLAVGLALMVLAGVGAVVTEVLAMTTLLRVLPAHLIARVVGAVDSILVAALLAGSLAGPALLANGGVRLCLVAMGLGLPAAAVGITAAIARR